MASKHTTQSKPRSGTATTCSSGAGSPQKRQRAGGLTLGFACEGESQERCTRSRFLVALRLLTFSELLGNDIVAQRDTLVTDVHAGTRDKLSDLVLMLVAEGASERARGMFREGPHKLLSPPSRWYPLLPVILLAMFPLAHAGPRAACP